VPYKVRFTERFVGYSTNCTPDPFFPIYNNYKNLKNMGNYCTPVLNYGIGL